MIEELSVRSSVGVLGGPPLVHGRSYHAHSSGADQNIGKAARSPLKPIWADHHQVTALFAISRSTIYRLTEAGMIKAKKVGGRALWLVESVEEFIASQPELNARTGMKANAPNK